MMHDANRRSHLSNLPFPLHPFRIARPQVLEEFPNQWIVYLGFCRRRWRTGWQRPTMQILHSFLMFAGHLLGPFFPVAL